MIARDITINPMSPNKKPSETKAQRELAANDVLVAVMGPTGSGKSTFINLATQYDKMVRAGRIFSLRTNTIDVAQPFKLDGRRVFLLDTPGFDDTDKGQLEILRIIAITLQKQLQNGVRLHGIIYIHRISDIRVGGVAEPNFYIFRKLCGDDSLRNLVIATTMRGQLSKAAGQHNVSELKPPDDFFKPALEQQARMMHHKDDTVQSAHSIIRAILDNHPVVDKMQQLKEQKDALVQAIKEKDEETRKELVEEAAKAHSQIDKLRAEQANHAADYRRLIELIHAAEELRADDLRTALELQIAKQRIVQELHAARLRSVKEQLQALTLQHALEQEAAELQSRLE